MSDPRRFDLIIFDWDGTLADSAAQIVTAMQGAIGELQLPPRTDHDIRDLIGLGLNDVLTRLYPELNANEIMQLLISYRDRYLSNQPPEAPLFAGALEALEALNEYRYLLAVATGKSRKGMVRSFKRHERVGQLMIASRTADETASKPDPLMLRELLQELDVPAERALMVGDTEYDTHMATALGMAVVGVECGVHNGDRLRAAGAEAVIEDVAQLPLWLGHR